MITINKIKSMKGKEKIAMLTCYDYSTAKMMDSSGIDILLVGDSLSMVVYGNKSTRDVTMQDMIRHTSAVARGRNNALIVGDMPYRSFKDKRIAIRNAREFIKAGADAVKIEGGRKVIEIVKEIIHSGIPVMGHVGLLPQSAKRFSVMGKTEESAKKILEDAVLLEKAGCFSIVLESIPVNLAKKITESVKVPTIGIGAGKYCDGQVLVVNDMLGLFEDFKPKFVKRYAYLAPLIRGSCF